MLYSRSTRSSLFVGLIAVPLMLCSCSKNPDSTQTASTPQLSQLDSPPANSAQPTSDSPTPASEVARPVATTNTPPTEAPQAPEPVPAPTPSQTSVPTPVATAPVDFGIFTGAGVDLTSLDCLEKMLTDRGFSFKGLNASELLNLLSSKSGGMNIKSVLFPPGNTDTMIASLPQLLRTLLQSKIQDGSLGFAGLGTGSLIALGGSGGTSALIPIGLSLLKSLIQNQSVAAPSQSEVKGTLAGGANGLIQTLWGKGLISLLAPGALPTGACGTPVAIQDPKTGNAISDPILKALLGALKR